MPPSASSPRARRSLRRLSSPYALEFSVRLLDRGTDGLLTFQHFLEVARDIVREQPDQSATFLAALVALDMGAPDEEELGHRKSTPSPN